MRCVSTVLLLAAALGAPGACFAQAQQRGNVPADAAPAAAPADPRTDTTRSAFGRVMAVMIAALQQQASEPASPATPVRTTAAGTPMDIEVGAAFNDAARAPTPSSRAPRTAPSDLALSQAALAGPH